MGNRISIERCDVDFGVRLNCTFNATWSGAHEKSHVPTEPDIAGVGVVFSFIAVTAFAALLGLCMLAWNGFLAVKYRHWKLNEKDDNRNWLAGNLDFTSICDKLITACSDQQIVVGSAYLWGVHNGTGCTTSFYHLVIVSNMIVLSCATHLLCLVCARHYYRNPYIAMVRIILIFVIIGYAGKLMSGGYTEGAAKLPSGIPKTSEQEAVLFLSAPCFMKRSRNFMLQSDWSKEAVFPKWQDDETASRFLGWHMYLMIVSYSALAVFITWMKELFRPPPLDRRKRPRGLRRIVHDRHNVREFMAKHPRLFAIADWTYRCLGVGAATGAIINSAHAIIDLRSWAQSSGWLVPVEGTTNSDEADINDLGQLLAAFSCALIFFVLVEEVFTELKAWRKRRQGQSEKEAEGYDGTTQHGSYSAQEHRVNYQQVRNADHES